MWPHGHDPRWDRMQQMQQQNPSGSHTNHNINQNANHGNSAANMPGCLCNDWTNIPIASSNQLHYHQTPNTHHQQHLQHHQQKMGHHSSQYVGQNSAGVGRMNSQWYTPAAVPNFLIGDTPASNSREMRNRAEKLRRDKLNSYIGELATLVPMVSSSAKRMDKTSILRLTATHLRIHRTLLSGQKPKTEFNQIDSKALHSLIYEQLEGFLLVLTPSGSIVFVSHTVEQLLGHLQTDLMGQKIYTITLQQDQAKLRTHLSLEMIDIDWRRYFTINLAKAGPRTEAPTYEQFNVMGMIRQSIGGDKGESSMDIAQTSTKKDIDYLLIFFVKLYRPPALTDMLIEANKEEYVTRHLIDGRIVNCDHRISFVAGYMIEEVSGLSAFKFMHREDVRWTMIGLRQMYDRGESVGWSCYRLRSRTGRFIYLRTLGYLEVDNTGLVESFVCINTLVSEEEGKKLIREMKERYSVMIHVTTTDQLTENEMRSASVEDPRALDECIKLLITNHVASPKSEPSASPKPSAPSNESQDCFTLTELGARPHAINIKMNCKSKAKRLPNDDDNDDDDADGERIVCTTRKRQKRRTVSSSSASSSDLIVINEYQSPTQTPGDAANAVGNIVLHQTGALCRPNINDRRLTDQSSVYQSHNLLNNLGM